MRFVLLIGLSSLVFALILTPLFRDFFLHRGFVDHPDHRRKLHRHPIPHMGGIPLAIAYLLGFVVLLAPGAGTQTPIINFPVALKLLAAAGIVLLAGILDDRYQLHPFQKLAFQVVGAAVAFSGGVRLEGVSGHLFNPWLSFVITVVWLIACTNAFNLIDGIDGLAAGLGLFASATFLIAALIQQNLALAAATAALTGALLGFLRYNFSPATIFLGDSGSLLIGFLVGCLGAAWSRESTTFLGMTAPLMALAIPILDASLAVMRRFLGRQPIFRGDRGHIHHRLLALGFTERRVVLMLYGVSALGAMFSILSGTVRQW